MSARRIGSRCCMADFWALSTTYPEKSWTWLLFNVPPRALIGRGARMYMPFGWLSTRTVVDFLLSLLLYKCKRWNMCNRVDGATIFPANISSDRPSSLWCNVKQDVRRRMPTEPGVILSTFSRVYLRYGNCVLKAWFTSNSQASRTQSDGGSALFSVSRSLLGWGEAHVCRFYRCHS